MFNKFLTSSVDPNKTSVTIKGILVMFIPLLMYWTGLDSAHITEKIDLIVQIVSLATSIASTAMIIYGLIRKLLAGQWSAK